MEVHLEDGTIGHISIAEAHRIAQIVHTKHPHSMAIEYARQMKCQAMQNLEKESRQKVVDEQSAKHALYSAGKLSAVDCECIGELAEYLCARMLEHTLLKIPHAE